jgi:catechol 2,3-dioxygenase-like lactoylglutathione lyase family enzyme
MTSTPLDHIGLNVADLEKSIAFYREMFGFTVIEQWETPRQAFVGAGGTVLGLMEVAGYDYRAYTMAHLAFSCRKEDFPEVAAKVRRLNLEVVAGPKPQRGGETILFRDPSGNILEICYPSIAAWRAAQS